MSDSRHRVSEGARGKPRCLFVCHYVCLSIYLSICLYHIYCGVTQLHYITLFKYRIINIITTTIEIIHEKTRDFIMLAST